MTRAACLVAVLAVSLAVASAVGVWLDHALTFTIPGTR